MASQFAEFRSKESNSNFPGVEDVDPRETWEKKAQVLIVDVRRHDEFTGVLGHVPGATHIVLDTLPQRLAELPKNKTVVFVCLGGGRSARACAFAKENGFTSVYNLKGGMTLWNELALDVEGRCEE